jgi:hypothetical protein
VWRAFVVVVGRPGVWVEVVWSGWDWGWWWRLVVLSWMRIDSLLLCW